jgi:hypothetical protein
MKVEFNYTGRRRIHLNEFRISFLQFESTFLVNVEFDLSRLDLDGSDKIYLELSYQGFFQSIYLGTIQHPINLNNTPLVKELVFWIESVKGAIKVVDETNEVGLIRAKSPMTRGDILDFEGKRSGQKSFLPVNQVDLGEVPWKLNFSPYSVTLLVNNKIDDVKYILLNDPVKMGLIFPLVIREIANKIVSLKDYSLEGDDWFVDWNKYFSRVLNLKFPESEFITQEEEDEFVNSAVAKYCEIYKFTTNLKSNL